MAWERSPVRRSVAAMAGNCRTSAPEGAFVALHLLGDSPVFRESLRLIERIAAIDATVLIYGETGTGKELAARAIHYLSPRCDHPFIPVNCGAIPDSLVESELFGHERGAFTDARQASRGLVAQAEGGTLFLDEVEAMSARAQGALLRFLQDRTYRPVGGRLMANGNLRIIASSNVDLEKLVEQRLFRRDVLFRLNVLSVTMPPLRERGRDVIRLAEHFLARLAGQYGRSVKHLHPEAIDRLLVQSWPGNVRELENLMLRAFLLDEGDTIRLRHLETPVIHPYAVGFGPGDTFKSAKATAIAEFEKAYLDQLLARTNGNISLAARISHKDRSALNKLVRKHGMAGEQFRAR
jgi:DNA-binding NtrC family response regulator